MNRENAHAARAGIVRGDLSLVGRVVGIGVAQCAQFVDEARQARVAPAIDIECEQQQRAQIGLDASGSRLGHGQPIARQHLALMKYAVQQVVRWKTIRRRQPFAKQARRTREFRRGLAVGHH